MEIRELIQRRLNHWENAQWDELFEMLCNAKIEELKVILSNLD